MLKIYQDERREKYMKVRERDLKSRQNRTYIGGNETKMQNRKERKR